MVGVNDQELVLIGTSIKYCLSQQKKAAKKETENLKLFSSLQSVVENEAIAHSKKRTMRICLFRNCSSEPKYNNSFKDCICFLFFLF